MGGGGGNISLVERENNYDVVQYSFYLFIALEGEYLLTFCNGIEREYLLPFYKVRERIPFTFL